MPGLRRRCTGAGLLCAGALAFAGAREAPVHEGTIACWRFDEPPGSAPGTVLRDASPRHFDLLLPAGAALIPGRSGQALRPNQNSSTAGKRRPGTRNPTDSALNLGGGPWTIAGWFFLERDAAREGVILEIGSGPPGENELVTRLSVAPRENAFVLHALAPAADEGSVPLARRVEFPDPSGPPHGVALLCTIALVADAPLPRARWFHAAIVHSAVGELRLFLDGVPRAVALAELRALPRGSEAYVAVGCDARDQRPFPGAIDELRVLDHAAYATRFDPAAEPRAPTEP